MAYTTINKSSSFMNTVLYTGNGSTQSITGVGFQPGMVWAKTRDEANFHYLADEVRGPLYEIKPNSSEAQSATQTGLSAFNSDGFTALGYRDLNKNTKTYAAWNWKASGSQGSSNTAGSINTTYTSVNTTAGFSISTYTGNGSAGATIGHGLGVKPQMIIAKKLNLSEDFAVYHEDIGPTKYLKLNDNDAAISDNAVWDGAYPTASLVYLGNDNKTNGSGNTYVAYCFAEKTGYSKFGSYTGNGNADGTFVYTGFKPTFVITKKSSGADEWNINDTTRNPFNPLDKNLLANTDAAESDFDRFDALSNGFKMRTDSGQYNGSGATYIYMAFGQSLVGTNNIPNNAF